MATVIPQYFDQVCRILRDICEQQRENMERVARCLAEKVVEKRSIFITGCSHSSIIAQEMFYRAGGFLLMNPIFLPGMTLEKFPPTLTTKYERISGIAEAVLSESRIEAGDALIIVSVSGRNVVPVEMAEWGQKHGVTVIALTSVAYSSQVASRHPSGKRLYELSDYVLDMMGESGDAVLQIPGLPEKTAPTSSIAGIAIMHAVVSRTLELLVEQNVLPPVFLSANLDGADEYNRKLLAQYRKQIHYM